MTGVEELIEKEGKVVFLEGLKNIHPHLEEILLVLMQKIPEKKALIHVLKWFFRSALSSANRHRFFDVSLFVKSAGWPMPLSTYLPEFETLGL